MKKAALILCLMPMAFLRAEAPAPAANSEAAVLSQIQLLNQVPEEQLSDKVDPAFPYYASSMIRTVPIF